MKQITKKMAFLFILLVLLPSALASSLDVKVTDSKELSLEIHSDQIGWQNSKVEIFTQKGKLAYEYESQVYYPVKPVFEMLDCPNCKPGNYNLVLTLDNESLSDNFTIKREPRDWFWMITLVLVLGLFLLTKKTIGTQPIIPPNEFDKTSKKTTKKTTKKRSSKKKK